jgi:dUTP pyrophosphatase
LQIRSRSGLALKNGIFVLNSPGTIDGGFRAQIGVILYNIEKESFYINKGDRIAQAVLCPICEIEWVEVEDTDQLDPSERGMGGFGSTGI